MLNTFFSSQAVVDDTNTQLPPIPHKDHSLESMTFTTEGVSDVFQHLDITKACSPDSVISRLLKEGCHILVHPYSIIFNRSHEQGYFHSSWKDATIPPIHKKEDISLPSNYRPIYYLLVFLVKRWNDVCINTSTIKWLQTIS